MKGWSIFAHSVRLVFGNLGNAFRIALVPSILLVAIVAGLLVSKGLSIATFTDEMAVQEALLNGSIGFTLFLVSLAWMTVTFWIFVSWHRFVLLEEYPTGWIPPFRLDRILSYFGHLLLLGLVGFVLMLPVGVMVGLFGALMGQSVVGQILVPLLLFVGVCAVVVAVYRLSIILPAAAIGRALKLKEAWAATDGANGTVIVLFVVLVLAQTALQMVVTALVFIFGPVGTVFVVLATVILQLVNVSILTTMYGHYVEGRAIG